ncbi:hypothetical protein WJX81_000165 [Elliptochloris bilobata]|uniref:TOG domain-containing protein n=1 Tax=Elliptochloris bilobata TaxID=381761 RepID=A0AAW1S515_9CHLO
MVDALFEANGEAVAASERQRLWRRILGSLRLPGVLDEHAAELCGLVFSTLPLYDVRSQRTVLAALRVALENETFLRAFAASLLPAAHKAAAKLVEAQAALLDDLLAANVWRRVPHVLSSVLRCQPELLEVYAAEASGSPGLVRALLQYLHARPELFAQHRAVFLSCLCDKVLAARERPANAAVEAYQPLLATLTHAEFSGTLLPLVLRMAKRSPDSVLGSTALVLAMLQLDLSQYAAALIANLQPQLRHAKQPIRAAAVDVVAALARRCSSPDEQGAMLATLRRVLDGSAEARPRSAGERAGLVQAVAALAAAPGSSPKSVALAGDAVGLLYASYREEAGEDVRLSIIGALGVWLGRLDAWPPDALSLLKDGLGEKEALRRAHLRALVHALSSRPGARGQIGLLAAALSRVVKEGLAKPTQRADGLAALLAAAYAGPADGQARAELEREKLWTLALQPTSALLAPAMLAKLPAEDASLAVRLAEVLLLHHVQYLDSAATATVARLLLSCLLHSKASVRREAAAAAERCTDAAPDLRGALISALLEMLRDTHMVEALVDPSAPAEDGGISPAAVAQRCLSALLAITPLAVEARGIASGRPAEERAAQAALGSAMAESSVKIFDAVLAALERLTDRREHDALSPSDVKVYQTPPGKVALEVDINALGAPMGVHENGGGANGFAANKPSPAKKAMPDASASRARAAAPASRSGTAGGARGRAGSGKPAERKDPAVEMHERQLAQEAVVRARVAGIRDRLARGLQALAGAAMGNLPFTAQRLEAYAALVTPLLSSPLVGEGAAFTAAHALAASLPGELGRRALAVACSLRLVELCESGGYEAHVELPERQPVVDTIRALASATAGGQPLPTPAYTFLFPVLRAVLSWPQHTTLHEQALAAVSLHVAPGAALPRAASLALLYHVLDLMPAYRVKVQPLLLSLCEGLSTEDLPAALAGLLAEAPHVRGAAIAALPHVPFLQDGDVLASPDVQALLWLARHDVDAANLNAGQRLWDQLGTQLTRDYVAPVLSYLRHAHADVRSATAAALAGGMQVHPDTAREVLSGVLGIYTGGAAPAARSGAAVALATCAAHIRTEDVPKTLDFLLGQALADPSDAVRSQMVDAGVALVTAHGGSKDKDAVLQLFEGYLERKVLEDMDEEAYDRVREGAVVFLGTLARHLEPSGAKVRAIVGTLMDVLATPSADVQTAVSACLTPLMPGLAKDRAFTEALVQSMLKRLLQGSTYGDRRGAALGIAGMVKGLGISAINGYGILDALKTAMDDQSNAGAREGALLALECLCEKLGRLFEPYLVQIMSKLLERFGDVSAAVRAANDALARAVMANLSSQGVKLVLPSLLAGVDSRAWRTKQGSVQMLGAMAYCAPKQLGTALPAVVPKLSEALTDPHPKVQQAARQALKEVGSVIRNPEVLRLSPALLAAIADPNKHAKAALEVLLSTVFIHAVDAASLALIVPVVHRGLRDRSGDAKKRAGRIVGTMCALINEPKDMAPYVPLLMPDLRAALVDPLPEVRATAARALGSLLRGMGEAIGMQELLSWLLATLKSEGSSVERSGAAQGLAEVVAVLGPAHLDALLPNVLAACVSRSSYVREGHLTLFKFLPLAIPDAFQAHLGEVLPAILDGLADEAEGVRDAALAAGRTAVELYAQSALPLLLPAVEAGIVNDNWRIRQSSVELLGDLLFKVAGTSGKVHIDGDSDDEGASTEAHGAAITEALGWQRRNEILARVYMARSDVGYTVRSAALHVWKTVVTNTPRTLAEILPALMANIIASLAAPGEERQQMAGACLGELVKKMGDRVLAHIIPILQQGITSPEAGTRQGVCYGLKELLENISRAQLTEHLSQLLPTVQLALVDPALPVRQAAGAAFSILFKGGASSAVDAVIPSLLSGLEGDSKQAGQALEGLRVILGVRPGTLAGMVPRLLRQPLHSTALRALGSLAEAAGVAINAHLSHILPPLLALASSDGNLPGPAAARESVTKVVAAVNEDGLYLLVAQLEKGLEDSARRRAAAQAITFFCGSTRLDFQEHVPSLLTALVGLMAEEDPGTLQACWEALGAVGASVPKEVQPSYVRCVKDAVGTAREKERRRRRAGPHLLPGFCLPKALAPILPFYLQGVLQGSSAELRELAAEGLGELVEATSEESLRPFTVQITGPLIRIIGDRFAWEIKAAITRTLGLLIAKAGAGLKPFVPQLQTTFLKCLGDQARQVRQSAAENLGELTRLSTRVDNLAGDLIASACAAEPSGREAYLTALRGLLATSGARLSPAVISRAGTALRQLMDSAGEDEAMRAAVAGCLGWYMQHCSTAEVEDLLEYVLGAKPLSKRARLGNALTLASIAEHAAPRLQEAGAVGRAVDAATQLGRDDGHVVRLAAARAGGFLSLAELRGELPAGCLTLLVPLFVCLLGTDQSSDVQRQQMHVLRTLAQTREDALTPFLGELVPSLVGLVQQTLGPTKLAAERSLARILHMDQGCTTVQDFLASGVAGTAVSRQYLTEAAQRRLSRLPLDEDRSF